MSIFRFIMQTIQIPIKSGQTNGQYKPRSDHPWRLYKSRPVKEATSDELAEDAKLPSLYNFLKDIVENWDTYDIPANEFTNDYVKMKNVALPKAAAWIVSFLQKHWVKKREHFEVYG